MTNESEEFNMENKKKILQLLNNSLISGYNIETMSDGRLYAANIQRYRNKLKEEKEPMNVLRSMQKKTERLFLEIANEVERVQPKNKKEVKEMVKNYCYGKAGL
ncbi:hypothetical protein [Enterococcus faecalis]|uniref:hypothetical protein n=1 Tax=Enterococcus faecalis TaxID=1351 RepID=UPI003C6CF951